jgi:hypothetical protein
VRRRFLGFRDRTRLDLARISHTARLLGRESGDRAASGRKNWRLWVELADLNFCESLWEQ